ncbi:hypothetical protein [Histophilus somni]|uniref:hypothetical protein n=1 Tax=Histophilus somni TaxID=731 RepID=UPI00201F0B18|nr:hypothetical protein [Histophilus somni]
MTPTETALKRIEVLLSNEHRNKLTLWEINFLNSCAKLARNTYKFDTFTMKQKQMIYNLYKKTKS